MQNVFTHDRTNFEPFDLLLGMIPIPDMSEESGFFCFIISMSSATPTALRARTAALRKNVEWWGVQGPGLVTYLAVPTRKTVCTTIMLPRGKEGGVSKGKKKS